MRSRKKRKKEGELRLTDKKHPASGIWAVIIGIFALVMFGVTCFVSETRLAGINTLASSMTTPIPPFPLLFPDTKQRKWWDDSRHCGNTLFYYKYFGIYIVMDKS